MYCQATKDVKLRFMRLVNDAGVTFKLNQIGKSFGKSTTKKLVSCLANGVLSITRYTKYGARYLQAATIMLLTCRSATPSKVLEACR